MSIESSKVLRNGKVLTDPLSHSSIENTNCSPNLNMESSSNSADEINRSGRSMLKAMMEKIISQNEERDKQNGGSIATSSYAVGTSNRLHI